MAQGRTSLGADLTPGALPALFRHAASPLEDGELAWYHARLPRGAGSVLDLACGAGRLLVPLLADGHAVHGIDASAAALALCEERLRERGLAAMLVREAMDGVNLPFRYAGAYAGRGAFQSLTDPVAVRGALQRLRAHLLPPGILLLELFVPSPSTLRLAAPLVELRTARLPDGSHIAVRSETTADEEARVARSRHRYVHRRGTRRLAEESESCALTWYSRDDIAALLAQEGFGSIAFDVPEPAAPQDAFRVSARLA
jgi:SAM-dependent methyltransferase